MTEPQPGQRVDFSLLSRDELLHAVETMEAWRRARIEDDRQRPSTNVVLMEIRDELRTFNSDRSQWYREVLDVLCAAKDPDGSLRSEQPAAAPGCRVCGNADTADGEECLLIPLTKQQWEVHQQHYFGQALAHEEEWPARRYAEERMLLDFGGPPIGPATQDGKDG